MKINQLILSFALLIFALPIFCQENILEKGSNTAGKTSFVLFNAAIGSAIKTSEALNFLKSELKPNAGVDFVLKEIKKDDIGFSHFIYQIKYNNLDVEGLIYLVHTKNDIVYTMNGNYFDVPEMSTTPIISGKQALSLVLKSVNAQKYIWNNLDKKDIFFDIPLEDRKKYYPVPQLLIMQVWHNNKSPEFVLAYKFEVVAIEPFLAEAIYISATDGKVIRRSDKTRHFSDKPEHIVTGHGTSVIKNNLPPFTDVLGSAQTRYSGTQAIWCHPSNAAGAGPFRLMEDNISGRIIHTGDNQHTSFYGGDDEFWDNDHNWTAAEWDNANFDNIALDIHWAAERSWDYFQQVHNYTGLMNVAGLGAVGNYAHYGVNFPDAFYFRPHTSSTFGMFLFGDGNATYNPFGSLDTYGHEYGHGIYDFTVGVADGDENFPLMLAIQEGLSDIWGAAIEEWAAPSKNHWLSGEEVVKNGGAFGNFSNPNALQRPDTYQGTYWVQTSNCTPTENNDYCGSHTNSGIIDFWFYLLCEGGNGLNDLNKLYNVAGIGITKAAKIVLRAERFYFSGITVNDPFPQVRQDIIQAAIDLYGNNSCEVVAVMNAWAAIGFGEGYIPLNSSLSFTKNSCNTANISTPITNGTSYAWQVSGDLLINGSVTSLTTAANNINVTGTAGDAYVVISGACNSGGQAGLQYYPYRREIEGLYSEYPIGEHIGVSVNTTLDDTYYRWYINNNLVQEGTTASSYCTCYGGPDFRVCGDNTIRVEVSTSCNSDFTERNFYRMCGFRSQSNLEVFPNPSKSSVNIQLKKINDKTIVNKLTEIKEIRIMDKFGNVRKVRKYPSATQSVVFNISDLQSDIYIIEASDGVNKIRQQLSIQ